MTVHYEFPYIHWWHTIAAHFEGNENFIVEERNI